MLSSILARHRGPYRFCVIRPGIKAGFSRSEFLKGFVESDSVGDEATALLTDPRDSIEYISVFSETEGQFVTTITKRGLEYEVA